MSLSSKTPKRQTGLIYHTKESVIDICQTIRSQWWKLSTKVERRFGVTISLVRTIQLFLGFISFLIPIVIKYRSSEDQFKPAVLELLFILFVVYLINLAISLYLEEKEIEKKSDSENIRHVEFVTIMKNTELAVLENKQNDVIASILGNICNLVYIYIFAKKIDHVRACLMFRDGEKVTIKFRDKNSATSSNTPCMYSSDPYSSEYSPLFPVVIECVNSNKPCFDFYLSRSVTESESFEQRKIYTQLLKEKNYESVMTIPVLKDDNGNTKILLCVDATKPNYEWEHAIRYITPYVYMLEKLLKKAKL